MTTALLSVNKIENIKDQLTRFYDGGNWVTDGVLKKLSLLPETTAFSRLEGYTHTIAELLAHIIAWRKFVLSRLQGDNEYDIDDASDWPIVQHWEDVLNQFRETHFELIHALDSFDPQRLEEVVAGRTYRFYFMLEGLIHHDYYHYGQIGALIAALQKP